MTVGEDSLYFQLTCDLDVPVVALLMPCEVPDKHPFAVCKGQNAYSVACTLPIVNRQLLSKGGRFFNTGPEASSRGASPRKPPSIRPCHTFF